MLCRKLTPALGGCGDHQIAETHSVSCGDGMLCWRRWMDAAEAKHHGLVNEVLEADALMGHVWQVAEALAAGPPLVLPALKEVAREAEGARFQDVMNQITKRQLASVDVLYDSADNLEGARAFAEKRAPKWKGR